MGYLLNGGIGLVLFFGLFLGGVMLLVLVKAVV